MKFGPEPVSIVRSERVSLAELCGVRIVGDDFQDVSPDGGKQLGRRLASVCFRILCGESFDLAGQPFELLSEQWMNEQPPAIRQH